jgi:hypothetical protein
LVWKGEKENSIENMLLSVSFKMRKAFCRFSLKRKLSMLLRLFNIQKALRANYLRSFKFFSPFEKLSGLQANEFVTVKRASTNAFTKVPQY